MGKERAPLTIVEQYKKLYREHYYDRAFGNVIHFFKSLTQRPSRAEELFFLENVFKEADRHFNYLAMAALALKIMRFEPRGCNSLLYQVLLMTLNEYKDVPRPKNDKSLLTALLAKSWHYAVMLPEELERFIRQAVPSKSHTLYQFHEMAVEMTAVLPKDQSTHADKPACTAAPSCQDWLKTTAFSETSQGFFYKPRPITEDFTLRSATATVTGPSVTRV